MLLLLKFLMLWHLLEVKASDSREGIIKLKTAECPVLTNDTTWQKRHDYWEGREGLLDKVLDRSLKHVFADMAPEIFFSTLNGGRIRKFFDTMRQGKRAVHIDVFGGSLTAGRFVGGIYGAWPAVLRDVFNNKLHKLESKHGGEDTDKVYPRLRIHNLATPATTSEWLLHRLPSYFPHGERNSSHSAEQAADMIIIDYNANDCASHQLGQGESTDAARLRLLGIMEALVRRLLVYTNAAIVLYDVAITHLSPFKMEPRCQDEYKTCYAMYEIFEPLVSRYGIPVISQKEALWQHYALPPPPEYWDCTRSCAHPKHKGHRMLADIQEHYFLHMLGAVSNSTTSNPSEDEQGQVKALQTSPFVAAGAEEIDSQVCKAYSTSIDHSSSLHMLHDARGRGGESSGDGDAEAMLMYNANPQCWTYGEDVPGKFGWLVNATSEHSPCVGAPLVFRVKFGSHESVTAMALQTFDKHAGMVEVSVSRPITNSGRDQDAVIYTYREKDFYYQGMIDNYLSNHVGDDAQGHSTIVPIRVDNEPGETDSIKAGAVQYLRLRLVNPNKESNRRYRVSLERSEDRQWPIRAKLSSLMTC